MATNIYGTRLSEDARDNGRWFTHDDGNRWRLASMRCKAYQDRIAEKLEPHQGLLAAAPNSEEAQRVRTEAVREAIAETLVKEWTCLGEDKQPLPCTPETVLAILRDEALDHVAAWVIGRCGDTMAFTIARVDAGNSRTGSAGS